MIKASKQYQLMRFFRDQGIDCGTSEPPSLQTLANIIRTLEPNLLDGIVDLPKRLKKRHNKLIHLYYEKHKAVIKALPANEHRRKKWKYDPEKFYASEKWRQLRYEVLAKRGARCECCGRTPREHRIVVHVDHVKPRYKHPELELMASNLQVLCEDCNLGKGARDETDWRYISGQPKPDGTMG